MAKQIVTALFDSREYANNAALMLRQAGVPDTDVTLSPETTGVTGEREAKGFWASLEDMFGGTDDHSTYAEGVRRGGVLVTAHVNDTQVDDAVAILEKHGSVDFDEREASWRQDGWEGATTPSASATTTRSAESTTASALGVAATPVVPVAPLPVTQPAKTASVRAGQDDVVQVVEERLDVGKRAVSRGKVRLHTSIVSTPVTETVSLRDETVTIDRRPVDRTLGAGVAALDPFQERVIEVDEVDEEAVVAKSVRVVEEIGIRKDVTDRVETISDTVRSTKVDIDDGRTVGTARTGLVGGVETRLAPDLEVVGSDGQHVGIIDHVDGGMIKLKKNDTAAGGQHHLVPAEWVSSSDGKVMLSMTAAEAMRRWTAAG